MPRLVFFFFTEVEAMLRTSLFINLGTEQKVLSNPNFSCGLS